MSRETSLLKKIAMLNEDDIPHDSYMLTILCDIAESLAVIADKLTDEKNISNEVLHKPKNGSDYPAKIMIEDREYIPVVRCDSCAFWGCVKKGRKGRCELTDNPTKRHDYCSYGERKEQENE